MVKFVRRSCHVAVAALCAVAALSVQVMAQAPPAAAQIGSLPRDLTPWGMFASAGIVVKLVILGLIFASLVTWTVTIAKTRELLTVRRTLVRDLATLEAASSLSDVGPCAGRVATLVLAGVTELGSAPDPQDTESIKERLASKLQRLEAEFGRTLIRGTGLLATIGATAPFVGLFGTVWGIMTSFIGISKQQTTNLAVVAPGIAEALLATAAGLVVAIPAVVIYNAFSRAIATNRAEFADAAAAVLRLASRDLSAHAAKSRDGASPSIVRRQRP